MVAENGRAGEVYNVGGHNERPNIFIVKTIIAQLHQRLADDAINETLIRLSLIHILPTLWPTSCSPQWPSCI